MWFAGRPLLKLKPPETLVSLRSSMGFSKSNWEISKELDQEVLLTERRERPGRVEGRKTVTDSLKGVRKTP
jgi:hypothetical protein